MLQRCIDNLIKEATRETPQSPNGVIDAAEALVHLHMVPARPPAAEAKQPDPPNLLNPLLPAPFPPMSQRAATRPLPPRAQPILPHAALNSMYFNSKLLPFCRARLPFWRASCRIVAMFRLRNTALKEVN